MHLSFSFVVVKRFAKYNLNVFILLLPGRDQSVLKYVLEKEKKKYFIPLRVISASERAPITRFYSVLIAAPPARISLKSRYGPWREALIDKAMRFPVQT